MGALPDRLTGFQHVENAELRAKFDKEWGVTVPPEKGWHLSQMFDAMGRKDLTALYVIGENPLQSEADQTHARHLLEGLEFMVVQDIFLTKTAEIADDEFPLRLTTGRRLDEYNTGVQTSGYDSPMRRGESLDISPEDAVSYGLRDGEVVRVKSRRGEVTVPVRCDESLHAGLTFMTLHFPDDVATNLL